MWTYEALVSLTFRCIDLLIIISLAGFIFWRWIIPFFRQEMAMEQHQRQELEDQVATRMQKADALNRTLAHDKQTSERLKKQIQLWRTVHEKKQQQRLQQKKEITAQLHDWYHERMMGIEKDALYQQVVPEAISQAEHELKGAFQDEKIGNVFNATIIDRLQKGST